jgi:dTDP-D-glucose 4,6-dehydratase
MKLYPNTSKIKRILSWKQKININVGLKKTILFYKKKYVQES